MSLKFADRQIPDTGTIYRAPFPTSKYYLPRPPRAVAGNNPFTTILTHSLLRLGTIFELFDVHWRPLKLVPFESLGAISYSYSLVATALSCIISEIKQDGRKSRFFHTPVWGSASDYWDTVCLVCYGQTRMMWLYDKSKILTIRLAISIEYRRVPDGRTDGQTSYNGIVRATHNSIAV